MNRLIRCWKGFVRIRLLSRQPERFLNLCSHHGIMIWELLARDGCYEMNLSVKDFFRLEPLCRKSGSRIRILEKHGMPFFLHRSVKRKAFFLGILLCAGLLFFLSLFIWNIHVTGNYANSTRSILNCLEEHGVVHGIRKREVNCGEIAALLREQFSNITWVSAKIEGTQLLLEIRENVDGYVKEDVSRDPVSLVASKEGTVVSIITRNGTPKVHPGDQCAKGDVLVDGAISLVNDSKEVYGYRYVHADADIFLETDWYYYDEFVFAHPVRTYLEPGQKLPVLQMGNYRFMAEGITELPGWLWSAVTEKLFAGRLPEGQTADAGEAGNKRRAQVTEQAADEVLSLKQLYLTENFALPVYYGYSRRLPYQVSEERYTEEEARRLAEEHFTQFSENLSEKGLQISENHVKIEITDTRCITKGTLRVIERAVEEQPCERQDTSPRKDQTVDEQE